MTIEWTLEWLYLIAGIFCISALGLYFSVLIIGRVARSQLTLIPHHVVKEWEPTGRIDICFPLDAEKEQEQPTSCLLLCEDKRTIASVTETEHNEVRWRKATPAEAKDVVVTYHKAKKE